jgi:hypothetical protein
LTVVLATAGVAVAAGVDAVETVDAAVVATVDLVVVTLVARANGSP